MVEAAAEVDVVEWKLLKGPGAEDAGPMPAVFPLPLKSGVP
jgi:hypothetical protein